MKYNKLLKIAKHTVGRNRRKSMCGYNTKGTKHRKVAVFTLHSSLHLHLTLQNYFYLKQFLWFYALYGSCVKTLFSPWLNVRFLTFFIVNFTSLFFFSALYLFYFKCQMKQTFNSVYLFIYLFHQCYFNSNCNGWFHFW